jgi:hypothetical protein
MPRRTPSVLADHPLGQAIDGMSDELRGITGSSALKVHVSSHGYFHVSSPRLPYGRFEDEAGNLYVGHARELGHGIQYMDEELAAYSREEIDQAIARGEPTSGPWSHLEMVLFTLGDDLNVHLDDPIVELACQEWVVANRDLLALPEGSLLPAGVGDGLATNGGSGSGVASADLLF